MDAIFEEVGTFGKFQKISLIIIGCTAVIPAFCLYVSIFTTAAPALNCRYVYNQTLNQSDSEKPMDICQKWNHYQSNLVTNKETSYECDFDTTYYGTTIINDWKLVCDREHLASYTQSFYLLGVLFAFISGMLSDAFGRKKTTCVCLLSFLISSILSNLVVSDIIPTDISTKYIVYNCFQFLSGTLSSFIYYAAYTLLIELTSHDYHTLVSNVNIYLYIVGELVIMTVYYLSKNWLVTSWFISVYCGIVLIPFLLYLPESPR